MDGTLAELLVDRPEVAGPRRRGALLVVVGVLAGSVLGAGAWLGTGWLRDADLRGALSSSTLAVEGVVHDLQQARDLRAAVRVIGDAPVAREQVGRQQRRVTGRSGPAGRLVAAELAAEQDVLAALAPLVGLGSGPLQAYGRARPGLQAALDAESATRAALGADRPAAAARLAVLDRLGPALDALAASTLERSAAAEIVRLRAVLRAVRTPADLRAAATTAAGQQSGVSGSATALGARAPGVARCADVVQALAGLSGLTGEDVSAWPGARGLLERSLGDPQAVASVDAVVTSAASATSAWQVEVQRARLARDADRDALVVYGDDVRSLTASLSRLDAELGPVPALDPVTADPAPAPDAVTTDPATSVYGFASVGPLAAQATARRQAAQGLELLTAPSLVAPEHAALVAAVRRGAELAQAAAGGAVVPPAAVAEVVRARVAAVRDWQAAIVRAAALVAARPLPDAPVR